MWSTYLLTTTCARTEASAMLRSRILCGPGAVTTPSRQFGQAYLASRYSWCTKCPGTYSILRAVS